MCRERGGGGGQNVSPLVAAHRERLEWKQEKELLQQPFFSLQRRTKNPDGGLSYTYKTSFSLCVSLQQKKKRERKTLIEKPMFITREHHIHLYSREQYSTLFGSKDGLSLYILIFGVPLFLPVFRVPYQCPYKGSNVRVKVQRNMQPILCSWDFSPSFSSSFPFLTLIPGSMAQHSVILSKLSPNFHAMRHSPKHIPTFDTINGRDETRKKKQVQPQFSPSSIFLF